MALAERKLFVSSVLNLKESQPESSCWRSLAGASRNLGRLFACCCTGSRRAFGKAGSIGFEASRNASRNLLPTRTNTNIRDARRFWLRYCAAIDGGGQFQCLTALVRLPTAPSAPHSTCECPGKSAVLDREPTERDCRVRPAARIRTSCSVRRRWEKWTIPARKGCPSAASQRCSGAKAVVRCHPGSRREQVGGFRSPTRPHYEFYVGRLASASSIASMIERFMATGRAFAKTQRSAAQLSSGSEERSG